MISSLTEDDFLPFEEFPLRWRFTEERYNRLPPEDLVLIRPLSKHRATEFCQYSMKYDSNASLQESEFNSIESFTVSNNEEETRNWLRARPVNFNTQVVVSWDHTNCVITLWRVFCEYWDDFCYPGSDDVSVWSPEEDWCLNYHHYEVLSYGTRRS